MSQSATSHPTRDGSDQALPPLPPKRPDDDPPMEPNPYMGGGGTPTG
jgi:hypothetical protein